MSKTTSILETIGPQIAGYWAGLAGWQRRLLLIAIGILALALAWAFAPKPKKYTVLFGGKPVHQRQLTRCETALAKANLADYEIKDGTLLVPRDRRSEYMTALDDGDAVPNALGEGTRRELSKVNPFESMDQRRKRLQDAHRREVAEIVRSLEGIEEAFVQYSESTKNRFSGEKLLGAIVAVRPLGQTLNPQLLRSVRSIVCSAQSGLQLADVTVVDLNSGRTFSGSDSKLAATDEYLFVKQTFERLFAAKVQRHLGYVCGLRVTANVELKRSARGGKTAGDPTDYWAPQTVSASLAVPASYLAQAVRRMPEDDARTPNEARQAALEEVRCSALAVLPQRPGVAVPPSVSVTAFDDQLPTSPTSNAWLAMLSSPLTMAVGFCFVFVSFALMWGMWKDTRQLRLGTTAQPPQTPSEETLAEQPLRVHDRLTELVRENPKVAADAITEWVRKAG